MKKIYIISLFILIICVTIIGVIYMFFFKKEKIADNVKLYNEIINSEYNHGPLTSIIWRDSSSYGGYYHSLELELTDDKYILKKKDFNYDENDKNVIEYSVTDKEFKEIEDIVKKYNLPRFKEFKEPEEFELDGNDVTMNLYYNSNDKYEAYSINYRLDIPKEGYEVLKSIKDKLEALTKSVNKIKEYKENE
jgi:hypothetical protein